MADNGNTVAETLGLGDSRDSVKIWAGVVIAALLLGGIGWYWTSMSDPEKGVRYVTTTAAIGDLTVRVTATGTVEPTNLVEISSELSGTLATVNVDFNDKVKVGTVLATLDTTKLEAQLAVSKAGLDAAIARVAMAQATLDEAREKYETALNLQERGIASYQSFISQKAAFIRAQAELQSAIADRALAEANLDLKQAELDKACICSPIDGVVLDRAVDSGQIVAASLSAPVLFTVAEDLTEMELQVDIDEADIGRIAVGNPAEFTVDAYDNSRFPAEISEVRFAPETIEGVVTYKAILTIDNSAMLLRPGMTATADITVLVIDGVLVVPNAALRYAPPRETTEQNDQRSGLLGMLMPERPKDDIQGDEKTIWVLRDGTAEEIPVLTGDTDGRVTAILAGELFAGDTIITDRIDD